MTVTVTVTMTVSVIVRTVTVRDRESKKALTFIPYLGYRLSYIESIGYGHKLTVFRMTDRDNANIFSRPERLLNALKSYEKLKVLEFVILNLELFEIIYNCIVVNQLKSICHLKEFA